MDREQYSKWRFIAPLIVLGVICLYQAGQGIIGEEVQANRYREKYTGQEAVYSGLRWFCGALICGAAIWKVNRLYDDSDL